MSTGAVFLTHKKRITERNSHLAGEASGSSISNACQANTERRRQLAGGGGDWERGKQPTRQCHRIPRNSVPRDCSSLGTLFYGQPSYNWNDKVKGDEMDKACRRNAEKRNPRIILVVKLQGMSQLGWLRRRRKSSSGMNLRQLGFGVMDWIDLSKVSVSTVLNHQIPLNVKKNRGLSLRANYTDRASAACRRSYFQLL
jgi:hypothetical protein